MVDYDSSSLKNSAQPYKRRIASHQQRQQRQQLMQGSAEEETERMWRNFVSGEIVENWN